MRQLTTQVAAEIIATDVFAGIWRAALRVSHQAVDAVLNHQAAVEETIEGLLARPFRAESA